MRITSKYRKLNKHALHAKLKTASHRFALMVDNYSPDDTEAENGLLMVTGKVFVPGYTDATVTIVYPKRKRSTDQSFYYITPTESTEDMSLAYSDDTFYPRFSECEQAVKDLPEVTVSQYFYDKGIIPDDPSTFTALTGIPLESSLVDDINEITGEDTNYYTIGANEEHRDIDGIIKFCTDYQDGDKIIPYLDITDRFFNNGTPTRDMETADIDFIANQILVSPSDFYNSLTILLRQPTEHPELNADDISNSDDWCITITSTFIPTIKNYGFTYSTRFWMSDFRDRVNSLVYYITSRYWYSLYSSLDEWASLVNNGVLQIGSQNLLLPDLYNEYHNVCGDGNPWTYKNLEFTIKTRDLEGFTPVEGLGNGVFHFVLHLDSTIEESLSHFSNPTFLNENPNDNQLYLTNLPNDRRYDTPPSQAHHLYSTVYFASNKRGREIVFLHLPDTLLSGCLDTAPSWTTLNYLKTQGQQLMNCLQETILSLSNDDENEDLDVVNENMLEDNSNDLISRLIDKGWAQQTPTTILSPDMGDERSGELKLQFTCIDNIWSLSGIIVSCEATGGEVPLPLSDTQLNDGVTSEDIQFSLEKASKTDDLWLDSFVKANSDVPWIISRGDNDPGERLTAIEAADFINSDIRDLSLVTPTLEKLPNSSTTHVFLDDLTTAPNAMEWIEHVLQAFNLPHSFDLPSNYELPYNTMSVSNNEYEVTFNMIPSGTMPLEIRLVDEIAAEYMANMIEGINPLRPGPEIHSTLWTDLFYNTPYADFSTILPGVGPYLTLLYVFNQPLLDDPQIINNIQRRLNRGAVIREVGQSPQEDNDNQEDKSWLAQVVECMNQSQIFEQTTEDEWSRTTEPVVINGTDYSQQLEGHITVQADPEREEINIKPLIKTTAEAENLTKYERSLIPENFVNSLTQYSLWVSAEKVNTLIGHNVLNGVLTVEQLTALEENTNDILSWLSNSSAQQVKDLQKVAGCVQYCDKILNNEEIPSLDFIKQGLHGNILNILKKNHVTGTTGVDYFLKSIGAVSIKVINGTFDMTAGTTVSHAAYDVCKYYAVPVRVDGWDHVYCALTFTKQNGKPVCQLQDDCLYMNQGGGYYRGAVLNTGTHLTTIGETFNSLVTGEGLPDYNLLHFLQEQLGDGLQATDTAVQMFEDNKEHVKNLFW